MMQMTHKLSVNKYPMKSQKTYVLYGVMLSVLCSISACHKITLTAVEAPITGLSDWQAVKSSPERLRYTAPAGEVIVYKDTTMLAQVQPGFSGWFSRMLHVKSTRTMSQSVVETQVLGKQRIPATSLYAVVKTPQDQWRRFEAYLLPDRLIWVDVDNNIDSKSYEEMVMFVGSLAN